jgi:hypothetical protein
MKTVAIIIVNYNLTQNIRNLLKSIKQYIVDIDFEIIVVDNNSPDQSIEKLITEFPDVKFEFLKTNYGFGYGNNVGASKTSAKYLLLLNPDTILVNNLVKELFSFAETHPDFGVIGPKMLYPDGSFQLSSAKFPNLKQELAFAIGLLFPIVSFIARFKNLVYPISYYNVDFVFGSCMFIKKEVFDQVGGFDEDYFLLTEETDLCYKIKMETDYRIIYWNNAKIIHLKSQITGKDKFKRLELSYESKLKFFIKRYSKFRYNLLKYFIVSMFWLKRSVNFRNTKRNNQLSEVYSRLISYYLNH